MHSTHTTRQACIPHPVISVITIATHIVLSWNGIMVGEGEEAGGRGMGQGGVRGAEEAWAG